MDVSSPKLPDTPDVVFGRLCRIDHFFRVPFMTAPLYYNQWVERIRSSLRGKLLGDLFMIRQPNQGESPFFYITFIFGDDRPLRVVYRRSDLYVVAFEGDGSVLELKETPKQKKESIQGAILTNMSSSYLALRTPTNTLIGDRTYLTHNLGLLRSIKATEVNKKQSSIAMRLLTLMTITSEAWRFTHISRYVSNNFHGGEEYKTHLVDSWVISLMNEWGKLSILAKEHVNCEDSDEVIFGREEKIFVYDFDTELEVDIKKVDELRAAVGLLKYMHVEESSKKKKK